MLKRKSFEQLTIQNDFMFCKVMQNMNICKKVLQLVLQDENISIKKITSQQTIENNSESKTVRLDVLVEDYDKNTYDVEMQLVENDDIPKRIRIYQASIDISKLLRGKRYKDATNTVIIFFCMFDPIGERLPVYTFENFCREDKDIALNDGTLKVIINVKAYKKICNSELKALVKYIYDGSITTSLTKEIDMTLAEIKKDCNALDEYISIYTKMEDERDIGRKEGEKKGRKEGIEQRNNYLAKSFRDMGVSLEKIAQATGLTQEEILKL